MRVSQGVLCFPPSGRYGSFTTLIELKLCIALSLVKTSIVLNFQPDWLRIGREKDLRIFSRKLKFLSDQVHFPLGSARLFYQSYRVETLHSSKFCKDLYRVKLSARSVKNWASKLRPYFQSKVHLTVGYDSFPLSSLGLEEKTIGVKII